MDEEKLLIKPETTELVKRVESVDQLVQEYMTIISHAYSTLLNVTTGKEALESLGQIVLVGTDLGRQLKIILDKCGVPPELHKNINQFTQPNLDHIWNNCMHFYQRFLHAQNPDDKIKELTRFYNLLKDVVAVAVETKTERYTTGVKRIKSVTQEF
jgi:hypothetical protein